MAMSGAERQRKSRAKRAAEKAKADQVLVRQATQQPALFAALPAGEAPTAGGPGAAWRRYCVQHFGSSLVARARMAQWAASQSLGELAAALGCDVLTAWRELGAALDAVTPYLHPRAPVDPGEVAPGGLQVIIAPGIAAAMDAEDARTITVSGTRGARDEG